MKKYFIAACMTLVGLCASAQQKGDMAVGLNLGMAPILESGASTTNFGIGAKFQYHITDPIRLEADADYWLKSNGVDAFTISANAHYLFNLNDKIAVYPLVGIGYAHCGFGVGDFSDFDFDLDDLDDFGYGYDDDDFDDYDVSSSLNRLLVNIGVGAQYALTSNISVGAEIKYQYIKDFCRLPITIGVTYKF